MGVRDLAAEQAALQLLPLDKFRELVIEADARNAARIARYRDAFGDLHNAAKTVVTILMKSGMVDTASVLPDDPLSEELELWTLKDPLERMKSFLYKQQLVDSDFFGQLETDADALAARIRKGCLEMPDPDPLSIFDDVYDETTPLLLEQKAAFSTYLDGFAEEAATSGGAR